MLQSVRGCQGPRIFFKLQIALPAFRQFVVSSKGDGMFCLKCLCCCCCCCCCGCCCCCCCCSSVSVPFKNGFLTLCYLMTHQVLGLSGSAVLKVHVKLDLGTRWWIQTYFIFTPIPGERFNLTIIHNILTNTFQMG